MFTRNRVFFLLVFFLCIETIAQSSSVLRPDFGQEPVFLPKGRHLIPLCNSRLSKLCVEQWAHQAQPLAVYQDWGFAPFQYFLPTFISDQIIPTSSGWGKDWEPFNPPSFSDTSLGSDNYFIPSTRTRKALAERRFQREAERRFPIERNGISEGSSGSSVTAKPKVRQAEPDGVDKQKAMKSVNPPTEVQQPEQQVRGEEDRRPPTEVQQPEQQVRGEEDRRPPTEVQQPEQQVRGEEDRRPPTEVQQPEQQVRGEEDRRPPTEVQQPEQQVRGEEDRRPPTEVQQPEQQVRGEEDRRPPTEVQQPEQQVRGEEDRRPPTEVQQPEQQVREEEGRRPPTEVRQPEQQVRGEEDRRPPTEVQQPEQQVRGEEDRRPPTEAQQPEQQVREEDRRPPPEAQQPEQQVRGEDRRPPTEALRSSSTTRRVNSRVYYRSKSRPNVFRVVEIDEQGKKTIREGTVLLIPENIIKQTKAGRYETKSDSYALPSTSRKVEPGCFVVHKPKETEADCVSCRNNKKETVLSQLSKHKQFIKLVEESLKKVRVDAREKFTNKILNTQGPVMKICSPEIPLQAIISNFNKTCRKNGVTTRPPVTARPLDERRGADKERLEAYFSYVEGKRRGRQQSLSPRGEQLQNGFKSFFKKAYCQSCKKGIPPEVMMAMMSIESAGRCDAELSNNFERSKGLFQVNAKDHRCYDIKRKVTYKRNTEANHNCFKDPFNSLHKSIEILFENYGDVNARGLGESSCQSWLKIKKVERDAWRRAVSSYNSHPGWFHRAIKSVHDTRTLTDTSYLVGAHKRGANFKYKRDKASWEQIRIYYLVEKLSPGNVGSSGRKLEYTISNLAHTEAVLGRNVKGYPGIVEIWARYVKEQKPPSCN